jgi:hypothetical protein
MTATLNNVTAPAGKPNSCIGDMVESDIHDLISRSVPYWNTLQAVTGGGNYWQRRQDLEEARRLLASASDMELPGRPVIGAHIRAAAGFLNMQKAAFMATLEAEQGPDPRFEAEDRLEQLRPQPPAPAPAASAAAITDKVESPLEEKAVRLAEFFNGEVVIDDLPAPAPAAPAAEASPADRQSVAEMLAKHPTIAPPSSPHYRHTLRAWSETLGWDLLPEARAIVARYREITGQDPALRRSSYAYSALELEMLGIKARP